MRVLSSEADLGDVPLPLRQEVADCLARWQDSGAPFAPTDDLIVIIEEGDTVDTLAAYLDGEESAPSPDFEPPFEWVLDRGSAYEAFVCWSDDGCGISVLTPKSEGIDPHLCDLCATLASRQPA